MALRCPAYAPCSSLSWNSLADFALPVVGTCPRSPSFAGEHGASHPVAPQCPTVKTSRNKPGNSSPIRRCPKRILPVECQSANKAVLRKLKTVAYWCNINIVGWKGSRADSETKTAMKGTLNFCKRQNRQYTWSSVANHHKPSDLYFLWDLLRTRMGRKLSIQLARGCIPSKMMCQGLIELGHLSLSQCSMKAIIIIICLNPLGMPWCIYSAVAEFPFSSTTALHSACPWDPLVCNHSKALLADRFRWFRMLKRLQDYG